MSEDQSGRPIFSGAQDGEDGRQLEVREQLGRSEGGDLDDPAPFDAQHVEGERPVLGVVRAAEVPGDRGLTVGAGRQAAEVPEGRIEAQGGHSG